MSLNLVENLNKNDFLKTILIDFFQQNKFMNNLNLLSVIQFGSTVKKVIKYESDIDLLYIFEKLPQNRLERFNLIFSFETILQKKINDQFPGHNFVVSSILKEESSLDHLSNFYLDMVECSNIIFDPNSIGSNLIKNIQDWITQHQSYKVQNGLLWYWVLDPNNPVDKPLDYKFRKIP